MAEVPAADTLIAEPEVTTLPGEISRPNPVVRAVADIPKAVSPSIAFAVTLIALAAFEA